MKKFLFALITILGTTSCIIQRVPASVETIVIDYSSYANSGFFITESNSVDFRYTPIGSVISEGVDGYKTTTYMTYEGSMRYGTARVNTETEYSHNEKSEFLSIYDVLDDLAYKCVNLGANGIINVKMTVEAGVKGIGRTYTVTGMAIYSDELPQPVYEAAPVNESREEYNQPAVMEREEVKQSARTRRY